MKFDIANFNVEVPSGSNILFLCPQDVLNVLYCHQPIPCALVTECRVAMLRVESRCVCVRVRPILVVVSGLAVAISIKHKSTIKILPIYPDL